jgi:pimeloyl-ACP methyl ester carboxylesterase
VRFVFLHGAGCTPDAFAAQSAAFPGSLAPDLHARAPAAADVGAYARALLPLLASIDEPYALVGSSMGAAVAIEAVLAGARASALVAIGCAPKLRVSPAILAAAEADYEAFVRTMPAAFFARPEAATGDEAMRELLAVGRERTLADFRACDAWDLGDRASAAHVPALVLTGELDVMTPVRFGRMLADRIPGARMRILAGTGHLAMAESPAETNEALRAFA